MGHLSRIGVSIDSELLRRFDTFIADKGYENRSEAFRGGQKLHLDAGLRLDYFRFDVTDHFESCERWRAGSRALPLSQF